MIGVLCNKSSQKKITRYFRSQFKSYKHVKGSAVAVFTIDGIDAAERTVTGYIVKDRETVYSKTSLPLIIFNLSVQSKKQNIKKVRSLTEIDGLLLINEANQYNQCYIMDILESSKEIKEYILPHASCSTNEIIEKLPEKNNILLKSENGTDFSKIIYVNNLSSKFNIISKYDCIRCRKDEIHDIISSITYRKEWILLETPDLITSAGQIIVVRAYLQKCVGGEWVIISKKIYPENEKNEEYEEQGFIPKEPISIDSRLIDSVSIKIADYINCFISDLGICFVDYIFDKHKSPYFLSMGGWNSNAGISQNGDISASLFQNMMDYARISEIQGRRG